MELSEIRTRIDAVDDQLLKLFLERMELAEEVAAYKNEHHLPILNKQREREILAKVTSRRSDLPLIAREKPDPMRGLALFLKFCENFHEIDCFSRSGML